MDIGTIEPGQDFVEAIAEAVGKSSVLIVMIGKQWLSITDSAGQRRLDNPNDFLRTEIVAALERDISVIPVLVEGASMPQEADLPQALAKLARRNAIEISDTRWDYDVEQLIKVLEKKIGGKPPSNKRAFLIGSIITSLILLGIIVIFLRPSPTGSTNTSPTPTNSSASAPSPKTPDTTNQPQFQAVVKPSEAEFVFPVDAGLRWQRNLEESKSNEKEYNWQVVIRNDDNTTYDISLFRYKNNPQQEEGDLENLVEYHLFKAVTFYDPVANERVDVQGVVLQKKVSQGRLSIVIKGEGAKRMFSSKPTDATFKTRTPQQREERVVSVPIVYRD